MAGLQAKPTVEELIHARLADPGSRPGRRNDPWKLAIVVEAGGMRFVVTAGMLALLEQYGIYPDLMVGTSSGAFSAAYYLAGHVAFGANNYKPLSKLGYLDGKRRRRFIFPLRFLGRLPVMDIERLVEVVIERIIPLNWKALKASRVPLYATAIDRRGQLILQPLHGQNKTAQKKALKNTARVPVVAHHAADKTVLWDGMLVSPLPVREAFEKGATHVLLVRSRGVHEKPRAKPDWLLRFITLALTWQGRDLWLPIRQSYRHREVAMEFIRVSGPELMVMALPEPTTGMAEDRPSKLFGQLVAAYHYAARALNLEPKPLPDIWQDDAIKYRCV